MMFPSLLLNRLIQRFNNEMPCDTPCSDCDCPETVRPLEQQSRYLERLEDAANDVIKELLAE